MTLDDVRALVVSVDPDARHYFSGLTGQAYTCWAESERLQYKADNRVQERGIAFDILRYTKSEDDAIANALDAALANNPDVAYTWTTEKLIGTDYVRHLFSCQCV